MNILFEKNQGLSIYPVFEKEFDSVPEETREFFESSEIFSGKAGEFYEDLNPANGNLIVVGMGKTEDFDQDVIRNMAFKTVQRLKKLKINEANLQISQQDTWDGDSLKSLLTGAFHANYSFDKYKEEKEEKKELELAIIHNDIEEANEILTEMKNLEEGLTITRNMVNEPSNNMRPEDIANTAKKVLEPVGVEVTIFDEKEIEEMGMEAFLSVGRGSDNPPYFIKMEYLPEGKDKEALALVGKGLAFDTGGYSLKIAKGMGDMKTDMAGAAAVIGAMYAIAKNKGKQNIVSVIATCENMISGKAYKPGDIVKTKKGLTIEVDNTDAEGRVTLADSIYYAATEVNSKAIVDVATLTGACIVALGHVHTGAVTNNDEFYAELKEASKRAGEDIWQLPNHRKYKEQIKSKVADLMNVSNRGAGAITAGLFLENFAEDKPWVHLDIAGTSYLDNGEEYYPQGATGVMVRTLYELGK